MYIVTEANVLGELKSDIFFFYIKGHYTIHNLLEIVLVISILIGHTTCIAFSFISHPLLFSDRRLIHITILRYILLELYQLCLFNYTTLFL